MTGTISNRLVKISDREERTIMSIEKVRAYFKPLGIEERIREFDVSSCLLYTSEIELSSRSLLVSLARIGLGVAGVTLEFVQKALDLSLIHI